MQPVYTVENTTPAFQLNWSVTLFAKASLPPPAEWLGQLKRITEPDGVRILEFQNSEPKVAQLLVSTLPEVPPSEILRSLKGRWQYLIRDRYPSVFRRNYFVGSIGEAKCRVLDQYIARQPAKHRMADPQVQKRVRALQFHDPAIDLGQVMTGNYGQYVYSLQVVLENTDAWHDIRESVLADSRTRIIRAAAKKRWRLSRIGMLSNHIHVLLGAATTESPANVALSLMNNLAHVQAMRRVFRFSYYVGTFGPYDRGVVRRRV